MKLCPSSYYKWKKRSNSKSELENEAILAEMKAIYQETDGIYGYRRLMMEYNARHDSHYNVKRLARLGGLKAVIRRKKPAYQYHYAENVEDNILSRDFHAEHANEKWLTDVTEMKYGDGEKPFLSAILDLGNNSVVTYTIGTRNNNALVFDTFDKAINLHPEATPLVHSDRGFQYTSKIFQAKLEAQGMTQYHLHTFDDYDILRQAIEDYIYFYNYKRRQKKLGNLSPMEYEQRKTGTFV